MKFGSSEIKYLERSLSYDLRQEARAPTLRHPGFAPSACGRPIPPHPCGGQRFGFGIHINSAHGAFPSPTDQLSRHGGGRNWLRRWVGCWRAKPVNTYPRPLPVVPP